MKQFQSIEKIDTGILYALELASSLSVLLLAFGLIASMANVLTKGSVLTDSALMRQIWAWTQCIAIDASVAGTIIRTFRYHQEGERVKTWLYGLLSVLLLFTAAIVSNIEAIQQTLNVTLESAYTHVFVSIEVLTWIRSISVVLLIVAHAMRHVTMTKPEETETALPQPVGLVITPELVDTLRSLLLQPLVTEEAAIPQALPFPQEQEAIIPQQGGETSVKQPPQQETGQSTYERVKAYLAINPNAKIREVAEALTLSMSTANKHMTTVRGGGKVKRQST